MENTAPKVKGGKEFSFLVTLEDYDGAPVSLFFLSNLRPRLVSDRGVMADGACTLGAVSEDGRCVEVLVGSGSEDCRGNYKLLMFCDSEGESLVFHSLCTLVRFVNMHAPGIARPPRFIKAALRRINKIRVR